jgi:thiopurine S-methyltransferase
MKAEMELNEGFWRERYVTGDTAWDMGSVSRPLKEYFNQITNKELKILIPGAGNAWEAAYLWEQGFKNVWICDIVAAPLARFQERHPDFPAAQLLHVDFFQLQNAFDLIIEQTFFCALDPTLREAYAQKMPSLLNPNGKLVGLMFDAPMNADRPPFGGKKEEYQVLFERYFSNITIDACYNSIAPRAGKEVFVRMEK